jgi:hypothetical protein
MQAEMLMFERSTQKEVARTFPFDMLSNTYILAPTLLVQAQDNPIAVGERYKQIYQEETGITVFNKAIAARVEQSATERVQLIQRSRELLNTDTSGFKALEDMLTNPDYQRIATVGDHGKTRQDIFSMSVDRYKTWYKALAEPGSIPPPLAA